jgi:hypothetical protein
MTDRMAHAFELCVRIMLVLSAPTCCAPWWTEARAIVALTRPSHRIRTPKRGSLRDRFSSGWSTGWPAAHAHQIQPMM